VGGGGGELSAALAEAIDRCTAKEADDRFPSAEALVEALDQAQLAAPEVPIPVRLLAQEMSTLSLVLFFIAALAYAMVINASDGMSTFDALLPAVILFGVAMARVLQVLSEARRVAVLGFAPSEILRGLRSATDERAGMREQLRGDPVTRARRRRTLISAAIQLPLALGMLWLALQLRTGEPGRYRMGYFAITLVFSGLILIGVSFVLLVRSPFRMPIGERLFRLFWLGTPGRAFLQLASRGVAASSASSRLSASRSVTPAPAVRVRTAAANAAPRGSLEDRVRALERWRDEQR
jgi:eukaryotic-like serine/threonine-protein kinase